MYKPVKTLKHVLFAKSQIRMFIRPSYRRDQDIVKELYLRELKNCKPFTTKPDDSEGQVKAWMLPKAPEIPEIDLDIEAELKAYEKETEMESPALLETKDPLDELFEKEEENKGH
ncbi:hypothetical protein T552_00702 [Pneumocystis carinii B80]|uniref:ATP synthase subunit H, mitochondrial n=1 Tax=Pneumocystis carinii (strain B80) TaxID=1408658 RepID=A0A0W4ZPF3_PNEC8|nr:hypothetical protein T552_00702 [Pneumocystis carinii B80]KTW30224.1 hypothetical protein T552_00702 [Pneumocystis carinii B80]